MQAESASETILFFNGHRYAAKTKTDEPSVLARWPGGAGGCARAGSGVRMHGIYDSSGLQVNHSRKGYFGVEIAFSWCKEFLCSARTSSVVSSGRTSLSANELERARGWKSPSPKSGDPKRGNPTMKSLRNHLQVINSQVTQTQLLFDPPSRIPLGGDGIT